MHHPHLQIRASAGSGKTFQLTLRFIALLLTQGAGKSLDTILASTFTRKAAAEISERVILRLADAVTSDDEREKIIAHLFAAFPELQKEFVKNATSLDLHSRETWQLLLTQLVRQIHRLRIGTLDSFFIKMANAFAFELDLPPHLSISDDTERDALIVEATRVVLESDFSDALHLANMLFKGESVRDVTTQMIELAQKLLAIFRETPREVWGEIQHLKPLDDDAFEKCVDEYRQCPLPTLESGNVHGSFVTAHEQSIELLCKNDWDTLVGKGIFGMFSAGKNSYQKSNFTDEFIACLKPLLDHANVFLRKPIAEQTKATGDLLEKIDAQFQKLQRRDGIYSFGDVSYLLAKSAASSQATNATSLLTQNAALPLAELMAHRLDAMTEHLLLDEFQDTARDQWKILQIFIAEMKRERGSFFCVGDTKQAIYGWRGGVVEIFDGVKEKVGDAENPLLGESLEKSFRSSQVVLDCVNDVFMRLDKNPALQIDKKGDNKNPFAAAKNWQKRFSAHTAAKEISGYVVLETSWSTENTPEAELKNMTCFAASADAASDDADSDNEDSGTAENQDVKQKDATLRYAVQRIKKLHQEYPLQTIGVLVRKNDTVRKLVAWLRRASGENGGIEVSEEGGSPLTDSAAVLLIKSLLQLGDHPGNRVARFHLLHSPLVGLLQTFAFSNLDDDAAAARASQQIRVQIERDGYGDALRQWSDEYLFAACNARERARLEKLIEWAYQYDIKYASQTRLDHFVKLLETTKHESPSQSRVRVMNINQAKGLEFDIVVFPEGDTEFTPGGKDQPLIVGRDDDLLAPPTRVVRYVGKEQRQCLPQKYQDDFNTFERRAIEESLCLLYVALTRARQMLVMIVAPRTPTKGTPNPKKTWEEILKQALAPKELVFTTDSCLTLYERGDKNCFASEITEKVAVPQKSVAKAEVAAAPRPQKLESLIFLPAAKRIQRVTPSAHDAEAYSPENVPRAATKNSPLAILMQRAKKGVSDLATAQLFGSAIHRCFQEVTWLDEDNNLSRDFLVNVMQRELLRKLAQPAQLDWDALYDYFTLCCQQPNVRKFFTRTAFADEVKKLVGGGRKNAREKNDFTVFTERQFLVPGVQPQQVIRGCIDRLVLARDTISGTPLAAQIIEIKTDSVIAEEKYKTQLAAYRFAVQQLYPIPDQQIVTQLVFCMFE